MLARDLSSLSEIFIIIFVLMLLMCAVRSTCGRAGMARPRGLSMMRGVRFGNATDIPARPYASSRPDDASGLDGASGGLPPVGSY
jgi:hypothetical protein